MNEEKYKSDVNSLLLRVPEEDDDSSPGLESIIPVRSGNSAVIEESC